MANDDTKNETSSFSRWYADPANRATLSKRRRDKYATDPEYREKQKKWSADARKRAKKGA